MSCRSLSEVLSAVVVAGSLAQFVYAEEKEPLLVEAVTVKYQEYAQNIRTSGILTYKSQQTLSFKTAGPVEQINVREGDQIAQDQLLARLRPEEIKAQVDEAEARLEMAQNNLSRYAKLHRTNVVSLDKLQSAETELTVAESKLRIARFNYQYSSIKATSDGTVLRRFVEENELVNAYQPVLQVADIDQGWVIKTGISDKDIVRLSEGDEAVIRFDAWPEKVFTGRVTQLATLADEKTGTFKIEISIEDNSRALRSGFVGKVTIKPARKERLAVIPVESVINSSFQTADVFVFDSENQTVSKRQIQASLAEPGFIASISGLTAGEMVVSRGAGLLRDGESARIARAGE